MRMRRRAGVVRGGGLPGAARRFHLGGQLSGNIDDRVSELTSETEVAPDEGGDRVFATSSTRGKYWREAGRVFDDRPAVGVGAGAFAVARLRHRTDAAVTAHAHGFVLQTLADLGIAGVCGDGALARGLARGALRTTALLPRADAVCAARRSPAPRRDWNADRIGLVALGLAALAFGLQSIIDWTWFIPGPAALALVAAGYVAGRGPLAGAAAAPPPKRPSAALSRRRPVWRSPDSPWPGRSGSRRPPTGRRATRSSSPMRAASPMRSRRTQDAEDLNPLAPSRCS